MLKVLFLEDDPQLLDRIAFVLESIKEIDVVRASDRHQAISLIKSSPDPFHLIIIDYHHAALTSLNELQKAAAGIDCILCVESLKNPPITAGWNIFATVERSFAPRLLHLQVEHWSRTKIPPLEDESPENYVRIKTKLLIDISPLLSDIYARLSERKYIKIFREGDVFDTNDLSRYAQQKKIEYMYLRADKSQEFIHKYIQFIEQHIREAKSLSMDEISFMHGSIHESVQELTDKLGFTRDVQALAKSQVQLTLKTMGRKPSLKSIMQHLESKRGLYSAEHCFMTGYVACAIASHLEWGSETTFHKLTLASFMHDISLADERLVDCETIEEVKERGLSLEAVEIFRRHPAKVADMIRQMSEIPPDVDSIVAQHHELPDGSGFPRGISARNISPLAMIFIVSHAITKDVLLNPDQFSLKTCLEKLNERFPQSHFKKVLTAAGDLAF
jgi:HD-GYP domain-containing protein (c-di-GMP phosphodiesterase class II)/CheY-like chemotaxis protein